MKMTYLLVFLLIPLSLIFQFSYYHEVTHAMINSRFGNCTTTFEASICGLVSIPSNCTFNNREEFYYNSILNSENEIIGYSALSVILSICLMGLFIVAFNQKLNSMQPKS